MFFLSPQLNGNFSPKMRLMVAPIPYDLEFRIIIDAPEAKKNIQPLVSSEDMEIGDRSISASASTSIENIDFLDKDESSSSLDEILENVHSSKTEMILKRDVENVLNRAASLTETTQLLQNSGSRPIKRRCLEQATYFCEFVSSHKKLTIYCTTILPASLMVASGLIYYIVKFIHNDNEKGKYFLVCLVIVLSCICNFEILLKMRLIRERRQRELGVFPSIGAFC